MRKIWIEKNTKWNGEERFYVMTEGECIAAKTTLEEALTAFDVAVENYKPVMVEKIKEIEL
jgi:hypothetical protein